MSNDSHHFSPFPDRFAAALERLADVWKQFLIDTSKQHRLSPLQLQILWVLNRLKQPKDRTVSALSRYFGVTMATISDSLRVLRQKGYVQSQFLAEDQRFQIFELTASGRALLEQLPNFADMLSEAFETIPFQAQEQTYEVLLHIIAVLQQQGVIQVQRMCFSCHFYRSHHRGYPHFCALLQQPLQTAELRLECPDYQPRS